MFILIKLFWIPHITFTILSIILYQFYVTKKEKHNFMEISCTLSFFQQFRIERSDRGCKNNTANGLDSWTVWIRLWKFEVYIFHSSINILKMEGEWQDTGVDLNWEARQGKYDVFSMSLFSANFCCFWLFLIWCIFFWLKHISLAFLVACTLDWTFPLFSVIVTYLVCQDVLSRWNRLSK